MLVYKIGHKNYVNTLSASGTAGRWASGRRMVIYYAESIPLAFLENMVRRQGVGFNNDYKTVIIEIPGNIAIEVVPVNELAEGWRNFKSYTICQQIGDKWYDEMRTPVLKAPSAVLPSSDNYIINANHPDFRKIKIVSIADLVPDERIEQILKNYKK